MAEILRCQDRWGRIVILHDDTWYEKILMDHAEVPDNPSMVEEVIQDPDRVNFDALSPNGENFYRRRVLQHPYDMDYLKVVVRFAVTESSSEAIGTVVSAYSSVHYRKAGERHKWSRSTQY